MESMVMGGGGYYFFWRSANLNTIWHFEDKVPQLHRHYALSYVGFIRQKVKQMSRPLVLLFISFFRSLTWAPLRVKMHTTLQLLCQIN